MGGPAPKTEEGTAGDAADITTDAIFATYGGGVLSQCGVRLPISFTRDVAEQTQEVEEEKALSIKRRRWAPMCYK